MTRSLGSLHGSNFYYKLQAVSHMLYVSVIAVLSAVLLTLYWTRRPDNPRTPFLKHRIHGR
jgi:hypothetical protein